MKVYRPRRGRRRPSSSGQRKVARWLGGSHPSLVAEPLLVASGPGGRGMIASPRLTSPATGPRRNGMTRRRPLAPAGLDQKERAVVGALIMDWPAIPTGAIGRLIQAAPDAFADEVLGRLIAAGRSLAAEGEPVERETLIRETGEGDLVERLTIPGTVVSWTLAEIEAQTVLDSYLAREAAERLQDEVSALLDHPDATLPNLPPVLRGLADAIDGSDCAGSAGPAWRTIGELLALDLPTPPPVVDGLLRRGEVGVIGGASKSFKSWVALDLALGVACGRPWMGRACGRGRVLLVNLELPEWAVRNRLRSIASARGDSPAPDSIAVWTLRGLNSTAADLRSRISEHRIEDLALVIVDPVYRLLAGRDENSASDIGDLLGKLAGIALDTGAHVLLPAHFAKGNASSKDAQDRVSGSGVFARFPDSLLTLTRHEEDGAFAVESVLRTFPPASPVTVRWQHPVFVIDDALDPTRLKQPTTGRRKEYDSHKLAGLLRGGPLTSPEWGRRAEADLGMPPRTFRDYRDRLIAQRGVIKSATSDTYYLPA